MTLYENIKSRREALNMSQQQLAEITGYTDRSSIAKVESGKVDLPMSKVIIFANALRTTPMQLIGWDTQETSASVSETEALEIFLEAKLKRKVTLADLRDFDLAADVLAERLKKEAK